MSGTMEVQGNMSLSPADRLAIGDALLRFAAGTDEGNAGLIASAFASKAVVDFGPCGEKLGLTFEPLAGRDTIVGFLAGTSQKQSTSHVVTNARAEVTGGAARSHTLVEATHMRRTDPGARFRMLNRYEATLCLEADVWRIDRLMIDNIWFEGEPRIMLDR